MLAQESVSKAPPRQGGRALDFASLGQHDLARQIAECGLQNFIRALDADRCRALYARADLHVHSRYSDGSAEPAEIVAEAAAAGLSLLVLTDHDTLQGCREAISAAQGTPLLAAAGIEVSAYVGDVKVHITGVGLDLERAERDPQFAERLASMIAAFNTTVAVRIARFNELWAEQGAPAGELLEFGEVLHADVRAAINVCHIRQALAVKLGNLGYPDALKEAEARCRYAADSPRTRHSIPIDLRYPAAELAGKLHELGAVPILAHPRNYPDLTEAHLKELRAAGVEGLEIFCTAPNKSRIADSIEGWLHTARRHGFFPAFASDCHGRHHAAILGRFQVSDAAP